MGWRGGTSFELKDANWWSRRQVMVDQDLPEDWTHKTPGIEGWAARTRAYMQPNTGRTSSPRFGWKGYGHDEHGFGFRQMPFRG